MSVQGAPIADQAELHGFASLATLAYKEAGLVLAEGKAPMIASRLRHRMRHLSLPNLQAYCDYVTTQGGADEREHMISALTTNVSSFFREPHHFEILKKELAPSLVDRLKNGGSVRIWSCGCSNGQEPSTIAMSLLSIDPIFAKSDFKILATDIDQRVLTFAKNGIYDEAQVSGVPEDLKVKYFKPAHTELNTPGFAISDEIKSLISYRPLNILGSWPMTGKFEAIFCRNVVIYFDGQTQDALWPRFYDQLASDGIVFVGHSERIGDVRFSSSGATAYRKSTANTKPVYQ